MSIKKIAIGTTALHTGLKNNGHLDGIGIYTQELLLRYNPQLVTSFVFQSRRSGTTLSGPFEFFPVSFAQSVLQSVITGLPFRGNKSIKNRFDLFHAPDHFIPKLKDIPVLATLHDPVPLMYPEWVSYGYRRLKNMLFKRSAQWPDHYLTISHYVVDDLVQYFNIPREKISVIHHGVNPCYFSSVDQQIKNKILTKFQLDPGFFLFIGTMQPRKNINRIIDAYCLLPTEYQKKHKLVIAGKNGWRAETEVRKLKMLSSQGIACWLDYVSPLEKQVLLQSASALVFPSLYEGFGLPVLEAFASNLPVITSTVTSLPEVAGSAALLVDPLSTNEISQAMLKIIKDPTFANDLRARGRQRAMEFTWEETAEKTWQLYQQLI